MWRNEDPRDFKVPFNVTEVEAWIVLVVVALITAGVVLERLLP